MLGLKRYTQIDHSLFQQIWQQSEEWGVEIIMFISLGIWKLEFYVTLSLAPSDDFLEAHYLFQFDKVVHRFQRYLSELSSKKRPLLNLYGQVQCDVPQPTSL